MDKIVFLATLAGKLSEYPMSAEDIENSIAAVKAFLDRISDADFAAEPPTESDAAEMAKDLFERYQEQKAAKEEKQQEAAEVEPAPAEEPEAAEEEPEVAEEPELPAEEVMEEEGNEAKEEPVIEEVFVFDDELEIPELLITEEVEPTEEVPEVDDEPPAPEEILEQLEVPESESNAVTSDEEFFEMLAKEAETERSDQARIEELELKALAIASKDDPEMVAAILSKDDKLGEMVANSQIAEEFDPIEGAFDPTEHPDIAFEESELTKVFSTDPAASKEFSIDSDKLKTIDEDTGKPKKAKKVKTEIKEKEKVQGTPAFWALLVLTLPITLPLFLAVCALFGIAYVAVSALIVALCAAMLGVVVVGTALALIGVIYGIIECFDAVPVGLYEIGVGLIVGGVTMLVSVLLTNLALRLVPKLYKHIGSFGRTVFGKLGDLYIKIKKECGKKK